MKILFIGPIPEPVTGQSLACQVFLDELVKSNEVRLVNLSKDSFKQGVESLNRVLDILKVMRDIRRKKSGCDIIYLTISESFAGNLKDLLIYLLCYRQLPKMIIHLHGGAGMKRIMQRKFSPLRWLNSFFLKRIGAIVILGKRHSDIYHGLDGNKIHIVPNFAQDYLFSDEQSIERRFARAKPLKILFLSNLLPGKGHIELVEAFRALSEAYKKAVEIDFAGGFESEQQRLDFLDMIAGHQQIHYHGKVGKERKRELFSGTHVFCLPTYYPYEGQPISILEAYASGCAVITTDHSGIYDTFADGVNGIGVEKQSVVSLRRAIELAVESPADLREMATRNLHAAESLYTTRKYNEGLMKILNLVYSQ